MGDLAVVSLVVDSMRADTVAVLTCPELDGPALRRLAWQHLRHGQQEDRGR